MEQYLLRGCGGDEMSFYQFERFTPKTVQEKRPCHTLRKGRTCINIFFQYFLDLEAGRRVIWSFLSQGLFWAETRKALSDQGVERAAPLPSLSEPGPHHLCPWRWHPRPAAPAFLCRRDSSGLRRPVGHWNGNNPTQQFTRLRKQPSAKGQCRYPYLFRGNNCKAFCTLASRMFRKASRFSHLRWALSWWYNFLPSLLTSFSVFPGTTSQINNLHWNFYLKFCFCENHK